MNEYTEGDLVHCTGTFSDPVTHGLVQPTDTTAKLKDPTGHVTTMALDDDPTTIYAEGDHFAFDADTTGIIHGQWWYRYSSPSVKQGAKENGFIVIPSNFS